ncbi:hypothetical protein EGW08_023204 [Elysia chlorotica]|uniref:Uncharacterized protein n=1 Tax=Elysia chlorotica TaxID=188477 RepID=A0A3S0Z856_ELYCH|nr:hypothetical protein EGW08_023204 [Elysia chlorotica]
MFVLFSAYFFVIMGIVASLIVTVLVIAIAAKISVELYFHLKFRCRNNNLQQNPVYISRCNYNPLLRNGVECETDFGRQTVSEIDVSQAICTSTRSPSMETMETVQMRNFFSSKDNNTTDNICASDNTNVFVADGAVGGKDCDSHSYIEFTCPSPQQSGDLKRDCSGSTLFVSTTFGSHDAEPRRPDRQEKKGLLSPANAMVGESSHRVSTSPSERASIPPPMPVFEHNYAQMFNRNKELHPKKVLQKELRKEIELKRNTNQEQKQGDEAERDQLASQSCNEEKTSHMRTIIDEHRKN